ncbi:SCO3242 family prenyltransferase [Streptomyces kebangsaanensis]|uniref:SCO3242 family prenyltransferase n=1 Tax=Streptomyces kebangsaanensis TaxID=864058 RepID=UPI00093D89C2
MGATHGSPARSGATGPTMTGTPENTADAGRTGSATLRAWAELLRLPALFTVPGDALAGAAAVAGRVDSRTLLAVGSSLCLYEAGMALNDWADRAEDARERPHRPLPSGRVRPAAALTAACAFTAAGLGLASRAGRPALAVAAPLAATVWAYDLALKHTPAGPVAMAAARGLDLLLGAAATSGRPRAALPSAALLSAHTLAVTAVSRRETTGGSAAAPLAALATTATLTGLLPRGWDTRPGRRTPTPATALTTALATAYALTSARPCLHAALNPSPPLVQRAVGGGVRAMIPLQAALSARAGAPVTALVTVALAPLARRFARKVSVT